MTGRAKVGLIIASMVVIGASIWISGSHHKSTTSPYNGRGEALIEALRSYTVLEQDDRAAVAGAIVRNFEEDRTNAIRWSLIYWGCVGFAAASSAIAALILKLESITMDEKRKKDTAAILSVCSAILVTLSTSGRYQEKWQANRLAAAQVERIGYQFLASDGADPRRYYAQLMDIQYDRALAIIGQQSRDSSSSTVPIKQKDGVN